MSGSHDNEVWVDDYTTSSGTHVSGHWRKRTHRGGAAESEPDPGNVVVTHGPTIVGRRDGRLVNPEGELNVIAVSRHIDISDQATSSRDQRLQAGLQVLRQRRATAPTPAARAEQPDRTEAQASQPSQAQVVTGLEALRRRRQALDEATSESAETGTGSGTDRCPSCGQFQAEGHTCPMPEGLPDGNYAELKGEERTKQMLADLQDSVTAIVQSGQLSRWLDAMASNGLNRWSFNNRMLSVLQVLRRDPNAELHLMGFRQWEKYNRAVNKGEKAVWILAPMTRKIREEDDNGKTRERTIVTGFKAVPVFNIDQTSGDPMPGSIVNHAPGEATEGTLEGLRDRVGQAGYSYEETEIPDYRNGAGTLGYTDPKTKKIVVDRRLSDAQKASTIAHELSHVHCGHVDGDYSEYLQHRGQMETEAEMTAYMVNRARGMSRTQADSFSPGYIAGWSRGKPEVITGAMERATKAFNTIMDGPWSSNSTKE